MTNFQVSTPYKKFNRRGDALEIYTVKRLKPESTHNVTADIHLMGGEDYNGSVQGIRCDCKGYQFRGKCAHIDAVGEYIEEQIRLAYEEDND